MLASLPHGSSLGPLIPQAPALLKQRRSDMAALGGLVIVVFFLFRKAVFGGEAIYERDIGFWYYPQVESIVRIVASGSWPLWDPYMSFGVPLLANPSAQILYPVTVLHLLLEPWTFYTFYVVGHLVFSGTGQYLLARRLGLSALGSFVAASAWMASGPMLSVANMWHHFSGAAWIPWLFLAAERACDTHKVRDALVWGAVIAGQILAGSADMCAIASLATMACVSRRLHWSRPRDPQNVRWLATVGLAWIFAVGLTAGQWLPSLELLPGSWRWGLSAEVRSYWSVHPLALLQVAVPVVTRGLRLAAGDDILMSETEWPLLDSLYLGVPILGLALVGVLGSRRAFRRSLVALSAGAVLVALGRHAFFYPLLVALLPPLTIVRYPIKAMLLVPFACGLLAGMGLEELRRRNGEPRRTALLFGAWISLLSTACAAVGALALAGTERWPFPLFANSAGLSEILSATAARAFTAGVAGLVVLLFLAIDRRGRSAWVAPALAAVSVAELVLAHRHLNPTAPAELLAERPATVSALARDGAQGPTRLYVWDYFVRVRGKEHPAPQVVDAFNSVLNGPPSVGRMVGLRMYYLPSGRWGLYGSFDRDILGLSPRYLQDLILAFRASELTPAFARLLAMASVNYVLALHGEGLEDLFAVAAVPGPFPRPIRIFRVRDPLPRAYAVGRGRVVEAGTTYTPLADDSGFQPPPLLITKSSSAFDPRQEVLLAEGPPVVSRDFAGTVRIVELKPDRVRIEVEFNRPGYVVLTDAYDPGWKATVDGERAAVVRANMAFRAVRVPAGRHVVEQVYRPRGVQFGLSISALSVLAGLGLALVKRDGLPVTADRAS